MRDCPTDRPHRESHHAASFRPARRRDLSLPADPRHLLKGVLAKAGGQQIVYRDQSHTYRLASLLEGLGTD